MSLQCELNFFVVIPAAGQRFAQNAPKQYHRINHKTVIEHTLELFLEESWVTQVIICLAENDSFFSKLSIAKHPKVKTVLGGDTRMHSVFNALSELSNRANGQDWVLIHDAARPCLHSDDLHHLVQTLSHDTVGGILASQVQDTMKLTTECNAISKTVSRENLWHALTPQMFRLKVLHEALIHCLTHGVVVTDDASAVEYCGYSPKVVKANYPNPKLTVGSDLDVITALLNQKNNELVEI